MKRKRSAWLDNPFYEGLFWAAVIIGALVVMAFVLARRAKADWGPAACGPVGPGGSDQEVRPCNGWKLHNGRHYYFKDGVQLAGWDPKERIYRTYDPVYEVWSEPKSPPWKTACLCSPGCSCLDCQCPSTGPCTAACTCTPATTMPQWMTHGVKSEKLCGHETYTLNGRGVGGAEIPKDARRNRLILIGSKEENRKVTDDLQNHAALKPLLQDLVVRDYQPDHWHVARAGFLITGHPSIYLQAPDGKVLHRADTYEGPEQLAEAIRRADPKYDPKKDPNLGRNAQNVSALPYYVAGGILALYLLWRARKT